MSSAKSTYHRLCSQLNISGSKSSTDKGDAPVSGGPKTPTKVSKRTGKVGSSSTKKPRGKKGDLASLHCTGQNGLLSVLKGLQWLYEMERIPEGSKDWLSLVDDVHWVLEGLKSQFWWVFSRMSFRISWLIYTSSEHAPPRKRRKE